MTTVLVDTSVVLKWFHEVDEREVPEARAILDAHVRGDLLAQVIDLAQYELGNILGRSLGWSARAVAHQLDDLLELCGPVLVADSRSLHRAALLRERHDLTFYDAAWAAAASELGVALVSADKQLVGAGLAESPTACVQRLRLDTP